MSYCPPREHLGPATLCRWSGSTARQQCGACGDPIPDTEVPIDALPVEVRNKLRPRTLPARKKQPGRRKREQQAYYKSSHWRAISKACLERDGRICQWCGEAGNQAAHLDPDKLWDTTLDDVLASCGEDNLGEKERRTLRHVLGLPRELPVQRQGRVTE